MLPSLRPLVLSLPIALVVMGAHAQAPALALGTVRVRGPRSEPAVRAAVQRELGGLIACYRERAGEVPSSSLVGALRLRVYVDARGEPAAAAVEATTLRDRTFTDCIAGRARAWRLGPPASGPTEVVLTLRVGGGSERGLEDAPAVRPYGSPDDSRETPGVRPDPVPPLESRVSVSPPNVLGDLAPVGAQGTIERRVYALRRCYEVGLSRRADLAGALRVRLTVRADGRVAAASVDPGTLGDQWVAGCVERVLRRLVFDRPGGEEAAEVETTVVFRPPPSAAVP